MVKFILDNFDTIFRDEKSFETFDKMILDLAVRGKLVPQIEDEEPASKLLEKIKEEKERLIAEKVIKKEKPLSLIEEDEKPFDIPTSWEWVRLGDISNILRGSSPRPKGDPRYFTDERTPYHWITIWDITNKSLDNNLIDTREFLTEEGSKKSTYCEKGEIIIAVSGSVGKSSILNINGYIYDGLAVLKKISNSFNQEYIYLFLKYFVDKINSMATGTAFPNINTEILKNIIFPVPPLEEQERIVEKVEKLQELSKKFKEIYNSNEKTRANLKKSILEEVEKSDTNNELLISLEKLFGNFEKVIKTKEDVKDIRNLVLSLAVRGKLVSQIEDEEPASKLLQRIKEEKERLVAEKVIKKEKPLPPITEDEKPYNIPNSWEWVRLGEICQDIHYGYTASAEWENTGVKLLRITDIQNNKVDWKIVPYCKIDKSKLQTNKLKNRDILIARTGGTVGKTYLVDKNVESAVFASYLIRAILIEKSGAEYTKLYMESLLYWSQLVDKAQGTGQPNVNATSLKGLMLPLPPLEEQERIVKRVDELMAVCDTLESKIEIGEKINQKLLASLLK